jgi:hypothetical protein
MQVNRKLGYFTASVDNRGVLALSSPSTPTIELPADEVLVLTELLIGSRDYLLRKAAEAKGKQERGR